jgi:serine/threonine-protein kinase
MTTESQRCPTCAATYDAAIRFCPQDGSPLGGGQGWRDPLVGTTLDGRYRILVRLGEGGFAVVYHARYERLGTDVAIKVLRRELSTDAEIVARFATEARTTSRIDHDNVVRVMDFGLSSGGLHYFATEYVPGTGLDVELSKAGRLPPLRAAHIVAQIAAGIARAHELGIVHRDVKPENVMLVRRGSDADVVKILDFGIARASHGTRLTRAGDILGTPHYMAPEMWEGRADAVDARSDIYALGAVTFELLTGAPPFDGSAPALLMHHLQSPPPLPSAAVAGLRAGKVFDEIVSRAMAKKPSDRFQSVPELLGVLSRAWAELGRPSGRLTYGKTLAAPPSRPVALPDVTAYESAPIDMVWDGGTLCDEIRRLHMLRARRLDELAAVLWPSGVPNRSTELREEARVLEDRIDETGEAIALVEAQSEELWERGREIEARLRLAVIDANLALAAARSGQAPTDTIERAVDAVRQADHALAQHHRRHQQAENTLRDRLGGLISQLAALEREVQPVLEKIAAIIRKETSKRPDLRAAVMAFAEIDGSLAAHQALLDGLDGRAVAVRGT